MEIIFILHLQQPLWIGLLACWKSVRTAHSCHLLLNNTCTASKISQFPTLTCSQQTGCARARGWQKTQPGKLDQEGSPYHMTSCSAIKLGQRRFSKVDTAFASLVFVFFYLPLLNCLHLEPMSSCAFAFLVLSTTPTVRVSERLGGTELLDSIFVTQANTQTLFLLHRLAKIKKVLWDQSCICLKPIFPVIVCISATRAYTSTAWDVGTGHKSSRNLVDTTMQSFSVGSSLGDWGVDFFQALLQGLINPDPHAAATISSQHSDSVLNLHLRNLQVFGIYPTSSSSGLYNIICTVVHHTGICFHSFAMGDFWIP